MRDCQYSMCPKGATLTNLICQWYHISWYWQHSYQYKPQVCRKDFTALIFNLEVPFSFFFYQMSKRQTCTPYWYHLYIHVYASKCTVKIYMVVSLYLRMKIHTQTDKSFCQFCQAGCGLKGFILAKSHVLSPSMYKYMFLVKFKLSQIAFKSNT